MPESELMNLVFEHLFSEVTSSSGALLEGYSEWISRFEEKSISLGWSWTILSDGATQIKNAPTLTTNIMLISEQGYDIGPAETASRCFQKISKIHWAEHAAKLLKCQ